LKIWITQGNHNIIWVYRIQDREFCSELKKYWDFGPLDKRITQSRQEYHLILLICVIKLLLLAREFLLEHKTSRRLSRSRHHSLKVVFWERCDPMYIHLQIYKAEMGTIISWYRSCLTSRTQQYTIMMMQLVRLVIRKNISRMVDL